MKVQIPDSRILPVIHVIRNCVEALVCCLQNYAKIYLEISPQFQYLK